MSGQNQNAGTGDIIANINDLIQRSRATRNRIANNGAMPPAPQIPQSLVQGMPAQSMPVQSIASPEFVELHTPQEHELMGGGLESDMDENPVALNLDFDMSAVNRAIHNYSQLGGKGCGCDECGCADDLFTNKNKQNGGGCGYGTGSEDIFLSTGNAQAGAGCGCGAPPRPTPGGSDELLGTDAMNRVDGDIEALQQILNIF